MLGSKFHSNILFSFEDIDILIFLNEVASNCLTTPAWQFLGNYPLNGRVDPERHILL